MSSPRNCKWHNMRPFWKARIITALFMALTIVAVMLIRTYITDRVHDVKWIISITSLSIGIVFFIIEAYSLEGKDRSAHRGYTVRYHFSTVITIVYIILSIWPLFVKVLQAVPIYQHIANREVLGSSCGKLIQGSCNYQLDPHVAIAWGIMYSLDFCFFQYRWTYRVLPCIFVSSSFFIMFFMMISATKGENAILGFGIMNPERLAPFTSNTFTKWLGWSLIGTVLATFASKATEDLWHGMGRNSTGDYAKINYRFKYQRRKLLTYSAHPITRIGILQILFIGIVGFVGGLLLLTKAGSIRQFMGQIYFVGTALAVLGFALHQFITDSNLLRSENAYIKDRIEAAKNSWGTDKKHPCRQATWEWMCYCQTLANIYCSRSPIMYENSANHNLEVLLPQKSSRTESVCATRIVSDLVYNFEKQFVLYCSEEAKAEQSEIELQFADSLMRYIESNLDQNNVLTWNDNTFILETLAQMHTVFFKAAKGRFSISGYPEESVKSLLLLDYLKRLLNYKEKDSTGHSVCRMFWLCHGEGTSSVTNKRQEQAEKLRRLFPYEMLELLLNRWKLESIIFNSKDKFGDICEIIICDYNNNWDRTDSVWTSLDGNSRQDVINRIERYKSLLSINAYSGSSNNIFE